METAVLGPVGRSARRRAALMAVALFLGLWQAAGSFAGTAALYIGSPAKVVSAGLGLLGNGQIAANAGITGTEFLGGLVLAVLVGVPLGVALGRYRRVRMTFEPLVIALYATPLVAVIPVLDAWLGVSGGANAAAAFLLAVIPVVLNTETGIRDIDPVWVRAVQSFGGTERDVFLKVVLPGALPAEMTGIRLAVGRALLGAIVGEMYVSEAGLGQLIMTYGQANRTNHLIFLVFTVAAAGYLLTVAARWAEARVARWRQGALE
jgi:ABC-type nitrate/sulfonate/bicarbonate transport system permease component